MRFWTSLLWIVGELAGESLWLWMLAVGCLHFNGTSMALPRHFHTTSKAFQLRKKIYIVASNPHRSRDSVSPVCGISKNTIWLLQIFSEVLTVHFCEHDEFRLWPWGGGVGPLVIFPEVVMVQFLTILWCWLGCSKKDWQNLGHSWNLTAHHIRIPHNTWSLMISFMNLL